MSLNSLWKKIKGAAATEIESNPEIKKIRENIRVYERFHVWNPSILFIKLPNGIFPIKDLSYGGFAVESNEPARRGDNQTQIQCTLFLLNRELQVHVFLVHATGTFAGYRFQHDIPETLMALGEFMEYLRYGSTLTPIAKEHVKDKYKAANWHSFRGDGPTDLIIRFDTSNAKIEEALLNFRYREHYYEVSLKNNQISTGQTLDQFGVAQRMSSETECNIDTLRRGIQVLMGIKQKEIQATASSFFEAMLNLHPKGKTLTTT